MPKLTLLGLLLIACILNFIGTVYSQDSVAESVASWQTPEDIDWDLIRQYRQRFQQWNSYNEFWQNPITVTNEDSALYRRFMRLTRPHGAELFSKGPQIGLTPLSELGSGTYFGETGGLYGDGRNDPPDVHREAALRELARISPLDDMGRESPDGKVVLLSIGVSNTTMEFSAFKKVADEDPDKAEHLLLVDGAYGGQSAGITAFDSAPYWEFVDHQLNDSGASALQVQVAWIKQVTVGPIDPFPVEARILYSHLVGIMKILRARFPNLRIAYLSSRIYGGYASISIHTEPHAYETAFANRWLILDQIRGHPELNYDPEQGSVLAPLLLWGPYMWADGLTPRQDGLIWEQKDFDPDGTHPNSSGQAKVTHMLLEFFKTDPLARTWFLGSRSTPL